MLPYSFYVSDEELLVPVGTYLEKNKGKKKKKKTLFKQCGCGVLWLYENLINVVAKLCISVSVEKVLTIVYQQQAVFRIRPVNRCSQTIAGNVTIHHVLFF